jgi:glycine hydroxymethyltransferase
LRLGTPALTTRGMQEQEMKIIAGLMKKALENPESETILTEVRETVSELCSNFPIYQGLDKEL